MEIRVTRGVPLGYAQGCESAESGEGVGWRNTRFLQGGAFLQPLPVFLTCLLGEQKDGGDHKQVKTCENRELEEGEEPLGATKVPEGVEQRTLGCPEGVQDGQCLVVVGTWQGEGWSISPWCCPGRARKRSVAQSCSFPGPRGMESNTKGLSKRFQRGCRQARAHRDLQKEPKSRDPVSCIRNALLCSSRDSQLVLTARWPARTPQPLSKVKKQNKTNKKTHRFLAGGGAAVRKWGVWSTSTWERHYPWRQVAKTLWPLDPTHQAADTSEKYKEWLV